VSITESLIKRRQFLFGAAGDTCALTCKRLAALAAADSASASNRSIHTAIAAEQASSAALMAAGNRCPHL